MEVLGIPVPHIEHQRASHVSNRVKKKGVRGDRGDTPTSGVLITFHLVLACHVPGLPHCSLKMYLSSPT